MTSEDDQNLTSRWAQAGAMFLIYPASTPLDFEQLLLDTARHISGNSRLFIMAASWLAKYGGRISVPRLAHMIEFKLEPEFKPVIGLLLDQARQFSGDTSFDRAISLCTPAGEARPLFEIERRNATLRKLAERHAPKLSRKWNLWAADFTPRFDAIRPEAWMASKNPK